MIKRFVLISITAVLLFLNACGSGSSVRLSSYSDEYLAGDYNIGEVSEFSNYHHFENAKEGIFFLAGNYLFYLDHPGKAADFYCFKPECLHNKETDPAKVPFCDAYVCRDLGADYVGSYNGKLYLTYYSVKDSLYQLIEMGVDGSGRKQLNIDMRSVAENSLHIHRGILFYVSTVVDQDGEKESALMAYDLKKDKGPFALYQTEDPATIIRKLVPYTHYIVLETMTPQMTENGERDDRYGIVRVDLRSNNAETVDMMQPVIFGGYEDKLVLRTSDGWKEYSIPENSIIGEQTVMTSIVDAEPDWDIIPDYVGKEIVVFSYFDEKAGVLGPDLMVSGKDGTILATLPGLGWGEGAFPITIDGEAFLIIHSQTGDSPYQINAYRLDELSQGILAPLTLLEVNERQDLTPGYIYYNE